MRRNAQSNMKSAVTDANGAYVLTSLAAGNYRVRQQLPSGWQQTTPANGYGFLRFIAAATAKEL